MRSWQPSANASSVKWPSLSRPRRSPRPGSCRFKVHLGGKIVFANPAAAKILGARTANALEGNALLDLVHPHFHPALLAGLQTMADQGGAAPMAGLRCLKLDGTAFDVEAQSIATSYDGKQVTLTSMHDISARKQVAASPSS